MKNEKAAAPPSLGETAALKGGSAICQPEAVGYHQPAHFPRK